MVPQTVRFACLILVALGCMTGRADAQSIDDARRLLESEGLRARARLAREIAKEAIQRARRAYVIGPDTGVGFMINTDGEADIAASGGIAFVNFDIDIIPDERRLFEFARERAVALFSKRVNAALARGKKPSNADLAKWARETGDRVIEELLEQLKPRRFESPRYAVRAEGTYIFRATAGEARVTGSLGLLYGFVTSGLVLGIDNGSADLLIPIEVSVPVALTLTPWSPLAELFVRLDVPVTGRDARSETFVLGLRLVMDVI